MVLGLLLARQGVKVTVFEKHADFLRDFRGDTVHPSTLQVFDELGLLDALLARPHTPLAQFAAEFEGRRYRVVDLAGVPGRAKFIAMMPQWEFLDFVAEAARVYPSFTLRRLHHATGLRQTGGRVSGLTGTGPGGAFDFSADLVVLADGRGSELRAQAALEVEDFGAPIDVLWFRLPKLAGDAQDLLARIRRGHFMVTIDRGDYWQCAWIIAKGGAAAQMAGSLAAFDAAVAGVAPEFAGRVAALGGWDAVKLLTVVIDRLACWWRPGLLAIGDAAHAMSPIGGVGINLAVQDAVAAARILGPALVRGDDVTPLLARVEARRTWPAKATQFAQVAVQDRFIVPTMAATAGTVAPPLPVRLLNDAAGLRRLAGRLIGMGVRPEHIA